LFKLKARWGIKKIMAYEYEGLRYDCGYKLGYLKATINFALKRPEHKEAFKLYLEERKKFIE